jgi:hypothetical protein
MMNTMGVARQCVAKLRDASGCASKAKLTFDYWFGIAQAEMERIAWPGAGGGPAGLRKLVQAS